MAAIQDMEGHVTVQDSSVPKGKSKMRFTFANVTKEEMHDLTITTYSEGYVVSLILFDITFEDPPDIRKVTVTKEVNGKTVQVASYNGGDSTQVDLKFDPAIQDDEVFTVDIEFDEAFVPGEWIEFSPSAKGGVALAFADTDATMIGSRGLLASRLADPALKEQLVTLASLANEGVIGSDDQALLKAGLAGLTTASRLTQLESSLARIEALVSNRPSTDRPVEEVRGVGPKYAKLLVKAGISTATALRNAEVVAVAKALKVGTARAQNVIEAARNDLYDQA